MIEFFFHEYVNDLKDRRIKKNNQNEKLKEKVLKEKEQHFLHRIDIVLTDRNFSRLSNTQTNTNSTLKFDQAFRIEL